MKDNDFTECLFIKKELCYLDYIEFCKNAIVLKLNYKELSKNGKIFYKWYVYANIHMTEYFKNIIWEYLNNDEQIYYINLINNISKYKFK